MQPMVFPKDDGAHEELIEWWYLNGHVASTGHAYGFAVAFFRVSSQLWLARSLLRNLLPIQHFYDFHVSVCDKSTGAFHSSVMVVPGIRQLTHAKKGALDLKVARNHLILKGTDQLRLRVRTKELTMSLTANAIEQSRLHGNDGVIPMGTAGVSRYYSRPSMSIKGSLVMKGVEERVQGTAWFDHQWGSWVGYDAFWTWLAITLDDGSKLMVFSFRSKDGQRLQTSATVIDADGTEHTNAPTTIKTERFWKSPASKITYPLTFDVRITALAAYRLRVEACADDNEIRSRHARYWEGPAIAQGSRDGKRIQGQAYVEIVGAYL